MSELSVLEKATLQSLASACNYSLSAHVPTEGVTRKFKRHLRGDVKRALRDLRKERLCNKHGGGRSTRWQLSRAGLHLALKQIGSLP